MKVIVTSGPGYEPIDEVRRITNFLTGELGIFLIILRNHFADALIRRTGTVSSRGSQKCHIVVTYRGKPSVDFRIPGCHGRRA
jgi:phosphopantothenoylcysteine synthetase/decarboxylase